MQFAAGLYLLQLRDSQYTLKQVDGSELTNCVVLPVLYTWNNLLDTYTLSLDGKLYIVQLGNNINVIYLESPTSYKLYDGNGFIQHATAVRLPVPRMHIYADNDGYVYFARDKFVGVHLVTAISCFDMHVMKEIYCWHVRNINIEQCPSNNNRKEWRLLHYHMGIHYLFTIHVDVDIVPRIERVNLLEKVQHVKIYISMSSRSKVSQFPNQDVQVHMQGEFVHVYYRENRYHIVYSLTSCSHISTDKISHSTRYASHMSITPAIQASSARCAPGDNCQIEYTNHIDGTKYAVNMSDNYEEAATSGILVKI